VLRFLERITGVRETNISDWRRRTFGDLTSALGFGRPRRPFPQLPDTKREFWAAEHEVATLPPATIPGAGQTPPHQDTTGPTPAPASARATAEPKALAGTRPYAISRIVENATTHRSDFPGGTAGTNFPGIQEAVPDVGPTTGTHVYTVGVVSFTLAVIDAATRQLVASVKAGVSPYGLAKTADGGKLYISSSGENAVSVYNTGTGKVTSTIAVGPYPHGLATSPDGRSLYVANTGPDTGAGGSQTLSVIDTVSDKVTATWKTGAAPHSIAPGADGRTLYVTCYDGLSVIDAHTGRQRDLLADQAESNGVAVHPDGTRLYVVNTWHDTLSVIDTRTHGVVTRVRVGRTPWQVAVSPDGSRAYVTNSADDTVSVIDTARNRVTATIGVAHIPTTVTATASTVWVATNASATIDAIDTKSLKLLGSTPLGLTTGPTGLIVA